MARLEFAVSLFSFGAASVFWLVAAFLVAPEAYGNMAQLQAIIMLAVATLSLRTYDLSFFLQRQHGMSPMPVFHYVFRVEIALLIACAAVVTGGLLLGVGAIVSLPAMSSPVLAVIAGIVSAFPVFQGSTQALLRREHRDAQIAFSDGASGLAFGTITAAVLLGSRQPEVIILLWLCATAVRPLLLVAMALTAGTHSTPPLVPMGTETMPGWRVVVRFLAWGQLANVVKNNGPTLELMLLSAFVGSSSVAVFRIARSFLQVSVVLINIVYQRAYRVLAKLEPGQDRSATARRIDRSSTLAWAAGLPLVAVGGAAFILLNPHQVYGGLWVTLPLLALATLPTALQQSQFADLAISGRYLDLNLSYVAGLSVLCILSLCSWSILSVELFAFWLFVANLARWAIMCVLLRRSSRSP